MIHVTRGPRHWLAARKLRGEASHAVNVMSPCIVACSPEALMNFTMVAKSTPHSDPEPDALDARSVIAT